jgi:predicted nuclease of predicted toxin-antitoxin system
MIHPQPPYTYFLDHALPNSVATTLRSLGYAVERLQDHFPVNAQDVDWLPVVSQRGWIILTKDKNIGKRIIELGAVANSNARLFTLVSGNISSAETAQVFASVIGKCEEIVQQEAAPFIFKIYKDGSVTRWRDANTMQQNILP